jgi:hypothetical protein
VVFAVQRHDDHPVVSKNGAHLITGIEGNQYFWTREDVYDQ